MVDERIKELAEELSNLTPRKPYKKRKTPVKLVCPRCGLVIKKGVPLTCPRCKVTSHLLIVLEKREVD